MSLSTLELVDLVDLAPLRAPSAAEPVLRLVPVPASQPLYDDEPGARITLPAPLPPLRELLRRPLHLVPEPCEEQATDEPAPPRTPSDLLPDVRPVAHAVVQGLLEARAGVRPLQQLQRTMSASLYDSLETVMTVRRRALGERPRISAVRSLHVQLRPDGVAEVSVRIQTGPRCTALAVRLEGRHGRWCATALAGL